MPKCIMYNIYMRVLEPKTQEKKRKKNTPRHAKSLFQNPILHEKLFFGSFPDPRKDLKVELPRSGFFRGCGGLENQGSLT